MSIAPGEVASAPRRRLRPKLRRPRLRRPGAARSGGVALATLAGFNDAGEPLVSLGAGAIRRARAAVALNSSLVGRSVVVAWEDGGRSPIVVGVIQTGGEPVSSPVAPPVEVVRPEARATVDGERLVFTAEHEIVLQCGEASITLTRAGKILLRGTYLLSRSSGENRIKGGSVQIN